MSITVTPKPTTAFFAQAALSFGVSVVGLLAGIVNLPIDTWQRSFLALGLLYVVTSTFSLAKCVRDQHEANTVVHRVDEARLERFLHEYDPFPAPTNANAR